MTLTEFLLARITEDEVNATLRQWHHVDCESVPYPGSDYTYPCDCGVPERMKAECEAKRLIMDLHALDTRPTLYEQDGLGCGTCVSAGSVVEVFGGPCDTLKALAVPYAGHLDYDEKWRP